MYPSDILKKDLEEFVDDSDEMVSDEEEQKGEVPAQQGNRLETFVIEFKEKDGDQGLACALECLAHMMFNLSFMLRHGVVAITNEPSYLFRWTFDDHAELARQYTERLKAGSARVYAQLVVEMEEGSPHLERKSINRAIVEYLKESLRITAEDVAGKHEGRGNECGYYYCASSSRLTLSDDTRQPVAMNFKFRADKRITQKTLDEAR